MFEFWFLAQLAIAGAATLLTLVFGFAKRSPNFFGLGFLALVELGLLAQLAISLALSLGGAEASHGQFEFFTYLAVALLVPILAVFWSLLERAYWSNFVLAVGAFTVFVMLARMHTLWF
ncbi:MAG: hypothetical protein RLZ28_469 [Actinomycetota bacterium]|jgi:hypothetical protein